MLRVRRRLVEGAADGEGGDPDADLDEEGEQRRGGVEKAGEERPGRVADIAEMTEHVSLAADPGFQDVFVEEMRFP